MNVTKSDAIHPPERIFNTLPIGYPSWLAFYDSIPQWHLGTEELQFAVRTERPAFIKYFGREPQYEGDYFILSYEMKKDFLLARCAEQMLPVRSTYSELLKMQGEFLCRETEDPDYLEPLFNAAIAISRRGK